MRSGIAFSVPLLAIFVMVSGACQTPSQPPQAPRPDDSVPANSLSDTRLREAAEAATGEASASAAPSATKSDPTQPYTTKLGEAQPGSGGSTTKPSSGGDGKPGSKASGSPTGAAKGGQGVASQAECDQAMSRFLELEIASNPQLKDVPPEIIEQAKQMARAQHGEMPCTATRAQYACAMAATSTSDWRRCMK